MKNRSTIVISLTIIYSILFYQQHVGINFLIFSIAILFSFFFQHKELIKNKNALLLSLTSLFSATFATIHGSYLAMWSTIISLMILPGLFINKRSTILIDFTTSFVNICASPIFMILDAIENSKEDKENTLLKLLIYIVPIISIIIFFFIYRAMNPLFADLTKEIVELISLGWIFFSIGGFLLVYGIINQKRSSEVDNWRRKWLFNINISSTNLPKWNEKRAFIFLFITLNFMLLAVNIMDLNYLHFGRKLPDGIAHKQFVHKGVEMLILSIILGISILLYFFRGELNFDKNKKLAKTLALIWLCQNLIMIYSTSLRNTMYINEALLSFKRIGVYFWLIFAITGLILLWIKLYKNKTIWFLTKYNVIVMFIVLIVSSSVDWDMIISNFNINRAIEREEISTFDKKYMLSLSEGNIANFFLIKDIKGFETNPTYSYSSFSKNYSSNRLHLDSRIYNFLAEDLVGDWRSFSFRRERVRNDIKRLDKLGFINELNFQGYGDLNLIALKPIRHLKKIDLSNCNIENWNELVNHPLLESVTVTDLEPQHLKHFKELKALKTLHIKNASLSAIKNYKEKLKGVHIF